MSHNADNRAPWAAALAETHTAVLLFMGDRAYKIKKSVRFPFLDFLHSANCESWLATAKCSSTAGSPRTSTSVWRHCPSRRGRRMPRSMWLSCGACPQTAASRRSWPRMTPSLYDQIRQIARVLAGFHATAVFDANVALAVQPEAVLQRWRGELRRDGTVLRS